MPERNVLVTGASSGIGHACAEHLHAAGWRVHAASRREIAPAGCAPVALDVDDDASVAAGIERVLAAAGRIDALVHCAGYGLAGAIEDTTLAEARAQLDTNFFGAVRVTRALLPALRRQGGGRLVYVSSLAAGVPLPYQAYYSASKAALSNWAEALRLELHPFGIGVTAIEPGNVRTGFTASRRWVAARGGSSPYAATSEASIAWMEKDEANGAEPMLVVRAVADALSAGWPPIRRVVAKPGERLSAAIARRLPQRLYEAVALRVFRVRL
jgi:NAD(P)-dependent dehydrogenase (short-subunit alcohol dehydrogenase family)